MTSVNCHVAIQGWSQIHPASPKTLRHKSRWGLRTPDQYSHRAHCTPPLGWLRSIHGPTSSQHNLTVFLTKLVFARVLSSGRSPHDLSSYTREKSSRSSLEHIGFPRPPPSNSPPALLSFDLPTMFQIPSTSPPPTFITSSRPQKCLPSHHFRQSHLPLHSSVRFGLALQGSHLIAHPAKAPLWFPLLFRYGPKPLRRPESPTSPHLLRCRLFDLQSLSQRDLVPVPQLHLTPSCLRAFADASPPPGTLPSLPSWLFLLSRYLLNWHFLTKPFPDLQPQN